MRYTQYVGATRFNCIPRLFILLTCSLVCYSLAATQNNATKNKFDKMIDDEFLQNLPFPEEDPSQWQWDSKIAERVLLLLGHKGSLVPHHPSTGITSGSKYPYDTDKGDPPEKGRGHGGMTYANWITGMNKLVDVSLDITFHTKPKPSANVYIQLYDFPIGETGQYFGFQYSSNPEGNMETKFIWSRWGTRDESDAWVAPGGWIESAGYEGDFVGIRYPYEWEKGTYTVHLMMRETDDKGTWYELQIYSHRKKRWKQIGRLRFPYSKSEKPFIKDGGGSWCEVFGGTTSSKDIGEFHLSYDGVYTCGRTVSAREVRLSYGKSTPNCDMALDAKEKRVHVMYGGKTRRITPAGNYRLSTIEPVK